MKSKKDVLFEVYMNEEGKIKSSIMLDDPNTFPLLVKSIGLFIGIGCAKMKINRRDTAALFADLTEEGFKKYADIKETPNERNSTI